MTTTMRKLMIVCICLAIWLMQSGCATSSQVAPPATDKEKAHIATALSADERTDLGTIGVVSAQFAPKVQFQAPAREKGAGAAAGRTAGRALGGLWAGCGTVMAVTAETVIIPALTLYGCAVVTPLVAVGGALHGHSDSDASKAHRAAKAKHKTNVKKLRPAVDSALDVVETHKPLQARVLEQTRPWTHHALVSVGAGDAKAPYTPAPYRGLARRGIDTVLEVTVPRLDFAPNYAFVLTAKVRFIRVADNVELYAATYTFETEPQVVSAWAADEAEKLQAALVRAQQGLAEEIVDDVLLRLALASS